MTPPTPTAVVVAGHLGSNGFYTTPIKVDLNATDPDDPSSALTTFYQVDGGPVVRGNMLTLGDGVHTLPFHSVDPAGNMEPNRTAVFKVDTTVPVVTAHADPTTLWPPNHKLVPVTVTGHVSDPSGGVPGLVHYRVIDEYGTVQPSGTARVDARGNYSFVVDLEASRLGQDKDGRLYTIVVTATDQAGNTGSARTFVTVPHDQGNHNGGGGDNGQGNQDSQGNGNGNGHGNHGKGHNK
jgi:hypothetical protein